MTLQELRTQLGDSQASVQRFESEHKRLTKSLANTQDTVEQHKNEGERLQNIINEMKAKHETEYAHHRKMAADFLREKSDLQDKVNTLKASASRALRSGSRFDSPLTPGGPETKDFLTPAAHDDDADIFGTHGRGSTNRRNLDVAGLFPPDDLGSDFADSPDASPIRKPFLAANHPTNEIEALQQRLAHAQRQINTLKGSLNREKQLRMRLEGSLGATDLLDEDEAEQEEDYVDENTAGAETKRVAKRSTTPFKVGARGGRGRGRGGRGGITLIQRLGMATNSPAPEFNDDEQALDNSPPPPVPSIPIHFNQPDDEDEVSQFFGTSHDFDQEDEQEENQERISRSPSPSPMDPAQSNRTSVDGMDPAFANVLRRIPSNGSSYTRSPLRQTVLGRSARGGSVGRRPRGGVPFKEARPPSIVDAPEVLATEMGDMDSSPLKDGVRSPLLNEDEILEEDSDDGEYIRVKKVEKVEFGCQTEFIEEEKIVVLPEPPVVVPAVVEPVAPVVVHAEIGVQSEPEPEPIPSPIPSPKAVTTEMSLQTEPEPVVVVSKSEMGIQHHTPEPIHSSSSILVDSGVGTDPLPEPTVLSAIGKGLPPLIIGDGKRRATITQSDFSYGSTSVGDSTITRSFLAQRHDEHEDLDEGEETETGGETEDDYHDARQSIGLSTPSEDFHSVRTMTDNDFSDSEDDAESIKASHFSSRDPSQRPSTASSFYMYPPPLALSYEDVGVGADLSEPPSPVIIEKEVIVEKPVIVEKEVIVERPVIVEKQVFVEKAPPKAEVQEMSIQTDEWKPPAPVVPVVAPIPTSAPVPKPVTGPGLYRVGSASHQFQFIPPPPSSAASNGPTSPNAPVFTAPSPVNTPVTSVFRESSGTFGRRSTMTSDRRQSIESLISSTTGAEDQPRSRVPSASAMILASVDKTRPPVMSLPPPPKLPPPPTTMPPPNFIPERRLNLNGSTSDGPPPRPSSPPPAELIHRATTPLGSILSVPGKYGPRQHGSSMPPSQANLRQPPSTSSFRSAANASHGQHPFTPSQQLSSYSVREQERRERSNTSLNSDRSIASPRSSMSSDHHLYNRPPALPEPPTTPNKTADITPRANGAATDPAVIHAITQTMIGEFLYKYTRRAIGKGVGERRHKRFFWVHPYTKTLYWSSADPGSSNVSESSAKSGKSLLIVFVRVDRSHWFIF